MTAFRIIAYLTFAVLFVGKTTNFAAAEVNTSATIAIASDTSSQGAIQPKTRGFAPLEGSIASPLSMLPEESVARTHTINTTTKPTVATHSSNTSVFMSPSATSNSSATPSVTRAQTKAVLTLETSSVAPVLTLSEENVSSTYYYTDTTSSHTSVSVTPWSTVSFTLTFPSIPHNRSASSVVGDNSTTAATASVSFSNRNFTVTFTNVSPTSTGQAHSVSIITQPTQPSSTVPAAPTSSIKNGGSNGVKPVSGRLVAVVVCLGGILFLL